MLPADEDCMPKCVVDSKWPKSNHHHPETVEKNCGDETDNTRFLLSKNKVNHGECCPKEAMGISVHLLVICSRQEQIAATPCAVISKCLTIINKQCEHHKHVQKNNHHRRKVKSTVT